MKCIALSDTLDHSRIHGRQNACWQFSSVATLCPLKGLRHTGHVFCAGLESTAPGPGLGPGPDETSSAMLQTGKTRKTPCIVLLRPTQVSLIPLITGLLMQATWAEVVEQSNE